MVDARGEGTVLFGPREPRCRRVQVSENIHHGTRIEEATKGRSTFARRVRRIGATPI